MSEKSPCWIGIEIGGTKLQVVVGPSGRIVERKQFAVDAKAGGEGIRAQIASVLPELIQKHSPAAVGVGFGGPVDWTTGHIRCSHQIAGWHDFPLAQWLVDKTGLPVSVDNDASVAALGESFYGAGVDSNPVFYITLGSGVGGGLVVDGRIYHGATPGQAEVGHLRLTREGVTVEKTCSGWAVDRRIREARETSPKSILFKLIGSETKGETRYLAEALAGGDSLAQEILRETAQNLALALSHVTHLMHPGVIILGGGLSLIGEPLRAAVAEEVPAFIMEAFRPGPRIALSALREDAVPIGALLLAANDYARINGQPTSR
jgi:glucokinase